ncbi:MAG: hypothetical protein P4L81_02510, partial [Candidatus Pacebacteria bacterium]|nr:hypothetical protein [Candidatus Paceibacterota bacterium]
LVYERARALLVVEMHGITYGLEVESKSFRYLLIVGDSSLLDDPDGIAYGRVKVESKSPHPLTYHPHRWWAAASRHTTRYRHFHFPLERTARIAHLRRRTNSRALLRRLWLGLRAVR